MSLKIILAIILIAVLAGALGYTYYTYTREEEALSNIDVVNAGIYYLNPVGSPLIQRLDALVILDVVNSGDDAVYVKTITADVYVNGIHAGSGETGDLSVAGHGHEVVSMLVYITDKKAIEEILNAITDNETVSITINGTIITPVKLVEAVEVHEAAVSYGVSFTQKLPWPYAADYFGIIDLGFSPDQTVVDRPVDVFVYVFSSRERHVTIEVDVKKDVASGPDELVFSYKDDVYLRGYGVIEFAWTPTEPSSDRVRGYFIEVLVNGERYYTMPESYPPRLTVLSRASIVSVVDAYWSINGTRIETARVGEPVEAVVVLKSSEEMVSTVKIVIKKDLVLRPDEVVKEQSYTVEFRPYENVTLAMEFTPTEPSSTLFRGYFIEVYVDGEKIYSMPASYPPRLSVS